MVSPSREPAEGGREARELDAVDEALSCVSLRLTIRGNGRLTDP